MVIKGKSVLGLNIVTVDTGSVIQTVKDIAYDPREQRIVALIVDNGGWFAPVRAILMDDVHDIGSNAVIVPSASVMQSVKQLDEAVRATSTSKKRLVATNVLTAGGKELGRVSDIYFDSKTGKVDSLEVSQGGLKTMTEGKKSIKPDDIVTIGADATIVMTYTELKLEAQGETGGLKGAYNEARHSAHETAGKIAASARETASEATEGAIALRNRALESGQRASDSLVAKSDELALAARTKASEIRRRSEQVSKQAAEVAQDKSAIARKEVTNGTKKLQATTINTFDTHNYPSSTVVEETAQRYQDGKKVVKTKKTVVRR